MKGKVMTDKNSNPFKSDDLTIDEEIKIQTTQENEADSVPEENEEDSANTQDNKLQEEYDKLNQQYIRLAADFENYRKRQAQEREALLRYGTENALTNLLEILDNFERGEKALENIDDVQKVKESFNLIHKQVFDSLAKLGLEEIKAIGEEFDPNFHEAVMQTPSSDHPENTVIAELQKGYKVGDKVIRPTMVNVATKE